MNFNDLLNKEEKLLEKLVKTRTLDEIEQVILSNTPYVIMSAWRGSLKDGSILDLENNIKNDLKLQQKLKSNGFDFILTSGVGQEVDEDTGKVVENEEDGVFIINMEKTEGRILANKFEQDFIVFGEGEVAYLLDVKTNSKERLGKFRPNIRGQFYTALRQNKSKYFTFK